MSRHLIVDRRSAQTRSVPWPNAADLRMVLLVVVITAVVTYVASHVVFVQLNDMERGDIHLHNQVVTGESHRAAGYTIYYNLLSWVAGGSTSPGAVRVASETILASAMAAKAAITLTITWWMTRSLWPSLAVTAFLMVSVPVNLTLSPQLYLGRLTGTIWHNSTTIVLIPVSVLLFFFAVAFLTAEAPRRAYWVLGPSLIVVDGLLKPNFLLALLPGLALFTAVLVLRLRRRTGVWAAALPILGRFLVLALPAAVLLAGQYVLAYQDGGVPYTNGVRPLATWSLLTASVPGGIPVVLLESFLLPALVTLLLWGPSRRYPFLLTAWLVTGVAAAQFAVLAEYTATGELLTHGNWSWGGHVAAYVLYISAAILWIRHHTLLPGWAKALVYVVAATYVATGVVYLMHVMQPGDPGYY